MFNQVSPTPSVVLHQGDALTILKGIDSNSVDSVVTDPPYGLSKEPDIAEVLTHWLAGEDANHSGGGFMGKSWDSFVPGPLLWAEVLRVLKPGGIALVFAGSRTVDLMGVSLRLGGFEIRDEIMWLYGQGWPKGQDVGKALAKEGHPDAGDWTGWHTQLKPAHEPVIVARKPLELKATANLTKHGTGAFNVDASRIEAPGGRPHIEGDFKQTDNNAYAGRMDGSLQGGSKNLGSTDLGRFPANVVLSHTADCDSLMCVEWCAVHMLDQQTGVLTSGPAGTRSDKSSVNTSAAYGAESRAAGEPVHAYADSGGASRFFYCSKSPKSERSAGLPPDDPNRHPTVKPLDLMRYLVRMVTPPGGIVLDPFVGSGTTALAAVHEGFSCRGIDKDDEDKYIAWASGRVRAAGYPCLSFERPD